MPSINPDASPNAPRPWPDTEPEHGKYTTYCNYGCRCRPCTDAQNEYIRSYRQRRRP